MFSYWTCPDWLQGPPHFLVSGNLKLLPERGVKWPAAHVLTAHLLLVLMLMCGAIPPVPYNAIYGMTLNDEEWQLNLHFRKQHKLERNNMECFDMYVKIPSGDKQIWFCCSIRAFFSGNPKAKCTLHCAWMHTYIYIHTHARARTHTHTHTHINTDIHTYLSHKYFRLWSGILNWIVFFTDKCGNVNTISTCDVSLLVPFSSACKAHNHARSSCDNLIALIEQSKNFWRRKCTALVVLTVPQHSSTGKWTVDPSPNALGAPRHTRNPK